MSDSLSPFTAARVAFEQLLQVAQDRNPIADLKAANLDFHPFGLLTQTGAESNDLNVVYQIIFVGDLGNLDASIKGTKRLIARYIGKHFNQYSTISLYIIHVQINPEDPSLYDEFYYVRVNNTAYMCLGGNNCGGAGKASKSIMDSLLNGLKDLYGCPVQHHLVELEDAPVMVKALQERLNAEWQQMQQEAVTPEEPSYQNGDRVKLKKGMEHETICRQLTMHPDYPKEDGILTVDKVENLPYICTCGLSTLVPKDQHDDYCPLFRRIADGHHQMLYVAVEGWKKPMSGYCFKFGKK